MNIEPVAVFRSPLKEKFGIPRQSGLAPSLRGYVEFLPPFAAEEALRGLEGFERLWLIWGFNLNKDVHAGLTVRPPRLGGNRRLGVWASRSPYRPNPLGLSCVKIESIPGSGRIEVSGADLADGTPIFDLKPYLPYADAFPDAKGGFTDGKLWQPLEVIVPPSFSVLFTEEELAALEEILSQDPRPQYQDDPAREYGLSYCGRNVKFRVSDNILTVTEVR